MKRNCSCCKKFLTPQELCKAESRGMEAERKESGLQGVLFRLYRCSRCGTDDLFVDIQPLDGESDEHFRARREDLEAAIRQVHAREADVVLVERHGEFSVWV